MTRTTCPTLPSSSSVSARHRDGVELAHRRLEPHQALENPPRDVAILRGEH